VPPNKALQLTWHVLSRQPAVSGSDSRHLNRQHPANSRDFEVGSETRHSSEFIQSLAWANGKTRPICCVPLVRQMASFVSDFDRLSFCTLRGRARECPRFRPRAELRRRGRPGRRWDLPVSVSLEFPGPGLLPLALPPNDHRPIQSGSGLGPSASTIADGLFRAMRAIANANVRTSATGIAA
jgi:hypothetical protein